MNYYWRLDNWTTYDLWQPNLKELVKLQKKDMIFRGENPRLSNENLGTHKKNLKLLFHCVYAFQETKNIHMHPHIKFVH